MLEVVGMVLLYTVKFVVIDAPLSFRPAALSDLSTAKRVKKICLKQIN